MSVARSYCQVNFIHIPLVARPGASAAELIRVLLPELAAPCADGFIRHDHATDEQEFLNIAVTEAKTKIEPHTVADDLGRETMILVEVGRG